MISTEFGSGRGAMVRVIPLTATEYEWAIFAHQYRPLLPEPRFGTARVMEGSISLDMREIARP